MKSSGGVLLPEGLIAIVQLRCPCTTITPFIRLKY